MKESGEYDTVRSTIHRYRIRGGCGGRGHRSYLFSQTGRGGPGRRGDNRSFSCVNEINSEETIPRTNGETYPNATCYGCLFYKHYRDNCPYATRTGFILVHARYMLTQGNLFDIPKTWLLLDTYSMCNVSNNPDLVTNIRIYSFNDILTTYKNGGAQRYDKLADLLLLPLTVRFKKELMATILSLKSVSEIPGARLTMDTAVDNSITFKLQDGRGLILNNMIMTYILLAQLILQFFKKLNLIYQTTHCSKLLQTIKRILLSRKSKERILHENFKSICSIQDQICSKTTFHKI